MGRGWFEAEGFREKGLREVLERNIEKEGERETQCLASGSKIVVMTKRNDRIT